MCIIKFSTQQHNGIYDTTNNLKIIIAVRGGNLLFLQCLEDVYVISRKGVYNFEIEHKTCQFFLVRGAVPP